MDVDIKTLMKNVNIANQRIARIEKRYGDNDGLGSWGVRNLYDAIDNSVVNGISQISGRIKIDKNMSPAQLKAIDKAVSKFIAPTTKSSTLKGINEIKRNVRAGIQKSLANPKPEKNRPAREVSDADAERLYSFVEDKTLRSTTEKIGASTLWNFLIDAKEKKEQGDKFGLREFMQDVKNHSEVIPDKAMRDDLRLIYNKYFNE